MGRVVFYHSILVDSPYWKPISRAIFFTMMAPTKSRFTVDHCNGAEYA